MFQKFFCGFCPGLFKFSTRSYLSVYLYRLACKRNVSCVCLDVFSSPTRFLGGLFCLRAVASGFWPFLNFPLNFFYRYLWQTRIYVAATSRVSAWIVTLQRQVDSNVLLLLGC